MCIRSYKCPSRRIVESSSLGFDLEESKLKDRLVLIDAYSGPADLQSTSQIVLPGNITLSDLSITLRRVTKDDGRLRFVFDELSSILSYVEPDAAFRFVQILVPRLRAKKATAIFILIPNVVQSRLENLLPSIFDGHFEMRIEDTGMDIRRLFRVRSMVGQKHKTDWVDFKIGLGGLHPDRLVDEAFPQVTRT